MRQLSQKIAIASLCMVLKRLKAFRSDDRGQVLLVTGMMAFLAAIFGLISMDTSQAIYNRITVQNSADAAAEAAALWQARGCNLLQHLNNIHYIGNVAAAVAESAALASCVAAAVGEFFFGVGAALCPACHLAPIIDTAQEKFADAIMFAQTNIAIVIPKIAYFAANDAAQGTGADDLILSGTGFVNGALNQFGIPFSIPSDVAGAVSGVLGSVGLTVYAFPLDPSSLDLHVKKKKGDELPWEYPGEIGSVFFFIGVAAGKGACGLQDPGGDFDNWGWDDEYYFGNPGYMTWIVGKTNRAELVGLGNSRWFNANDTPPAEIAFSMGQKNLPMYTGSARGGNSPLEIPAFVGLASSQVEGEPVVSKGDANAKGKLIQLFFPPRDSKGSDIFIYH